MLPLPGLMSQVAASPQSRTTTLVSSPKAPLATPAAPEVGERHRPLVVDWISWLFARLTIGEARAAEAKKGRRATRYCISWVFCRIVCSSPKCTKSCLSGGKFQRSQVNHYIYWRIGGTVDLEAPLIALHHRFDPDDRVEICKLGTNSTISGPNQAIGGL